MPVTAIFTSLSCYFQGLNKRIANGNLCDGLYIIYPDPYSPPTTTSPATTSTVLSTSSDQTNLWHSRLGHPALSTLKQIKYGTLDKYKARLVAKGFIQKKGIDYHETFAPVAKMVTEFSIKDLGQLNYYLGIEFLRNSTGLVMTQRKYALELISSTGLLNVKPSSIPIDPLIKLNHDDGDLIEYFTLYRTLVGKLLYLTITRPDIAFATRTLSQFSQAPRTPHLKALIKVLRYIKGCPGQGLIFPHNTSLQLHAYCDSDWANCGFSRRSVSRHYLGIPIQSHIPIYCDNASAIALASNPVQHARTKHIEIDYHFVREKIKDGYVCPKFISTKDQTANVLTKGLSKAPHYHCLSKFGICDPYTLPTCGGVAASIEGSFDPVYRHHVPNESRSIIISPEQFELHMMLVDAIDDMFFLKMRVVLNLSSKFKIELKCYGFMVPFDIDDVRRRITFPATNVEKLLLVRYSPKNFLDKSLLIDVLFSIFRPNQVEGSYPFAHNVANYLSVVEKKT
ncbi:uncharacterized mitochondrial protein-like protein [Tanacetum coccineum]